MKNSEEIHFKCLEISIRAESSSVVILSISNSKKRSDAQRFGMQKSNVSWNNLLKKCVKMADGKLG